MRLIASLSCSLLACLAFAMSTVGSAAQTRGNTPRPTAPPRTAPPRPATPAAPTLNFEDAKAEQLTVLTTSVLAATGGLVDPAFSRDGKRLAYLQSVNAPVATTRVVTVSLPDGLPTKVVEIPRPLGGLAWSPDGSRIFAVGYSFRDNSYVVDVASSKATSIGPVGSLSAGEEVIWAEETGIYFLKTTPQYLSRLDLNTLSSSPIGNDDAAVAKAGQIRGSDIAHPFILLGETEVRCTFCTTVGKGIAVFNRDGSYTRVLQSGGFDTAKFSPNSRYAVTRFQGELRLLTLGTRTRPRLAVTATVEALPKLADPSDLAGIRASLQRGEVVLADVFSPRVNPLNQRTVGADGAMKGRVQVSNVTDDGKIEGQYVREVNGYPATGDVLQIFWTPGPPQSQFRSVSAVVGTLTDTAAAPVLTGLARQFAGVHPTQVVLEMFDGSMSDTTSNLKNLLTAQGVQRSNDFCGGNPSECIRRNYRDLGTVESRTATLSTWQPVTATARLVTVWRNGQRCQVYDLRLTQDGWRIDNFRTPDRC